MQNNIKDYKLNTYSLTILRDVCPNKKTKTENSEM